MSYDPYKGKYVEQTGFPHQPHQRDVQRLTNTHTNAPLPNRQQRAAAQRQAEIEARQRNLRGNTRVHSAALPRGRGRNQDDDAMQRPLRSAVRYTPNDAPDLANTPGVQFAHHYHDEPFVARSSLMRGLPQGTGHQQQVYTDDLDEDEQLTERPKPRSPKRGHTHVRFHPLVWLGAGMIAMFFLWIGLSYASAWGQTTLNDWHYSRPRTFQIDAVVGHNDSATNPSHFIALNLDRHVLVIEVPGGDPSKARIYPITTLFGDGQNLTPVTLSFKDVNGDGLLDMEIHIQDQTLVMINENGGFRPLKAGEKIHL